MRRIWMMLLGMCLALSGCSGGGSSYPSTERNDNSIKSSNGAAGEISDEAAAGNESQANGEASLDDILNSGSGDELAKASEKGSVKLQKEMLVYRCRISIDTLDYDTSLSDLKQLLSEYECFIETENYSDNGENYSYYYIEDSGKHAQYTATIRVPSGKYDAFLEEMGSIGDVRNKNSSVENLNQEYTDTETALKIYKEQEKRYIQMIKDADDSYALQLQQQLTELEIKIAQLESGKRKMEMDVAYSYVDLTLREVQKYSPHGKTDTFMMRLRDSFSGSWSTFLNVMETLLTIVIYVWYYLVIILLIVLFAVRQSKKSQAKRMKAIQQGQIRASHMPGQPVQMNMQMGQVPVSMPTEVQQDTGAGQTVKDGENAEFGQKADTKAGGKEESGESAEVERKI